MIRIIILDDKKGGDEMIPLEDEVTEYKSVLTDGLKKEVLAFANTAGGNVVAAKLILTSTDLARTKMAGGSVKAVRSISTTEALPRISTAGGIAKVVR